MRSSRWNTGLPAGVAQDMQTFLPYADFDASARSLDSPRLGKQRPEVIQILKSLTLPDYGWRSHPAVLMWEGFEEALVRYGLSITQEWVSRGNADTCAEKFAPIVGLSEVRTQEELDQLGMLPPWLGREDFHLGHKSSLVNKDPEHYSPLFPGVSPDIPYVWPRRTAKALEREAAAERRAAKRAALAA